MGKSTINGPFSIAMLVHQRVDTMFECQVTHALSATTFSSPIYLTLDEFYTQTLLKGGLTPKKMLVTWVTET